MRLPRVSALLLLSAALTSPALCSADDAPDEVRKADDTVALFKKADPSLARFFQSSVGFAVFPSVVKGAIGIGGAGGHGVLYERGRAVGTASLAQVTVGLALGGQAYSEIIFFENATTLTDFKSGTFAFAAQVSAIAASAGVAAHAKYEQGVAVFTEAKGGLMYEASVGGQKFDYEPFGKVKK